MIIAKILAVMFLLTLSAGGVCFLEDLFDVPGWLLWILALATSASLFVLVLN